MHYVTFVAVDIGDYPIYKDTDERIKAEIAKLLKNKKDSTQKDVFAECRLSELKSLTNSFARAVNSAVEYRLEPYCECTEDEEYLEFIDETEDARKQYESGVDCIKLPDGKIVMAYTLSDRFCIKDGLVYQKKFGQLKQDKRSKKAKRMIALSNYPFKKLYKSFEEFAEQYRGMPYDIQQIEERFSESYGEPKKIEDIILDIVIMAPEMIEVITDLEKADSDGPKIYIVTDDWADNDEYDSKVEAFADLMLAKAYMREQVRQMADYGGLFDRRGEEDCVEESSDMSYEIYIEGWYCSSHYSIQIKEKTLRKSQS